MPFIQSAHPKDIEVHLEDQTFVLKAFGRKALKEEELKAIHVVELERLGFITVSQKDLPVEKRAVAPTEPAPKSDDTQPLGPLKQQLKEEENKPR